MRQFKIYSNALGAYEAVKQGWSWPAFFFGPIWALAKRMWALGFGVLGILFVVSYAIFLAVGVVDEDLLQGMLGMVGIGVFVLPIIFGAMGNKLRRTHLTSRGFGLQVIATAANGEDAIALHMKSSSTVAEQPRGA
ncbi:MAG: DUF2628 domain-containing protein [Longimicrobiales bacterium]|nr:DUF2628 domain-containing protein [Longimicrobiales bacterium]